MTKIQRTTGSAGSRPSVGDPDFIIAFQEHEDGHWHLDFQWGKKPGNPKAMHPSGVKRVTSYAYMDEPDKVFELAAKWPYSFGPDKLYVWAFSGKVRKHEL